LKTAGQKTYLVPVSNGIFDHCEAIGVAIWVFLWLIDRTTKEVTGTDGRMEGLVYGGREIRAREMANDLQMSARTVHGHLARLLKGGYLRKVSHGDGLPAGYCVLKSKKWDRHPGVSSTSPNSAEGAQDAALPSQEKVEAAKNTARLYRNSPQQHKTNARTKGQLSLKFAIPEWVPHDPWAAFLEMRHKQKRDLTEYAMQLIIRKLESLRALGQDPGAILDQSTQNGWLSLYELKESGGAKNEKKRSFNRAEEALDSALASGRAALASFGFDCGSVDETGRDDG
jgi:hypothetical protein